MLEFRPKNFKIIAFNGEIEFSYVDNFCYIEIRENQNRYANFKLSREDDVHILNIELKRALRTLDADFNKYKIKDDSQKFVLENRGNEIHLNIITYNNNTINNWVMVIFDKIQNKEDIEYIINYLNYVSYFYAIKKRI